MLKVIKQKKKTIILPLLVQLFKDVIPHEKAEEDITDDLLHHLVPIISMESFDDDLQHLLQVPASKKSFNLIYFDIN